MKSMTAFARIQHATEWGSYSWEIRAVNQRFLEVHTKLPEAWRHLESTIREQLKQQLQRGKIEVGLQLNENQSDQAMQIDQAVLQPLVAAVNEVQQSLMEATQVNPLDVLKWPGVLKAESADESQQQQQQTELLNGLQQAIDALNANREREGEALKAILQTRCAQIRELVEQTQGLLPQIIAAQTEKLRQRIGLLIDEADQSRFHQEVAILAQKLDVQEELDRLLTHLSEVNHVLSQQGAIGRRLDFLMQELNREANTLGSKSADSRTSQTSVELKVLIEQMREQVQNIE